jgi:hypothetical protein
VEEQHSESPQPSAAPIRDADADEHVADNARAPATEEVKEPRELESALPPADAAAFWPGLFYTPPGPEPDFSWIKLSQAYPDHRALQADTIYALPESLVVEISEEIPKFFTDAERQFEQDLTKTAGAGFFLQRRIAFDLLPLSTLDAEETQKQQESDERHVKAQRDIQQMMDEEMRADGATPEDIAAYHKTERKMLERMEERRWAYAGWLVTEPAFRADIQAFRSKWNARIVALGAFPVFPMSFFGERSPSPSTSDREFYDDYLILYKTWSLHCMATWDLPIPMRSEMAQPSFYDLGKVSDGGVLCFVPWYLLRDKDLKIRDLTEHTLMYRPQPHLKGWLNDKGGLGYDRFTVMLKMYICLELGLKARYGERMKGNMEKLDMALGRYFIEDGSSLNISLAMVESIRKIRQAMDRRLKGSE